MQSLLRTTIIHLANKHTELVHTVADTSQHTSQHTSGRRSTEKKDIKERSEQ